VPGFGNEPEGRYGREEGEESRHDCPAGTNPVWVRPSRTGPIRPVGRNENPYGVNRRAADHVGFIGSAAR
jgi:hypothetical protein